MRKKLITPPKKIERVLFQAHLPIDVYKDFLRLIKKQKTTRAGLIEGLLKLTKKSSR